MRVPFPNEETIERFVAEQIDTNLHCPISQEDVFDYVRQHSIQGYGVADIIKIHATKDRAWLTVLELKNKPLNETHLTQLTRYMVGLKRQARRYEDRFDIKFDIYGELAGPLNPGGDFVFLAEHLSDEISVYELSLHMDRGFTSEPVCRGWFNTNEDLAGGKKLARLCFDALTEKIEYDRAYREFLAGSEAHENG